MKSVFGLGELFEEAPGYIAVVSGSQHRFEVANAAYRTLVGRDVVGKSVAEVLPELARQGHVDLLDHVFRTGEPYRAESVPVDVGTGLATSRRYVSFIYQPLRSDGQVVGIFAQGSDVTSIVEAEEARRKSEGRLQAFFEQSMVGICEADLQGRFLRANRRYCELVGRSERELTELTMQSITHPDDLGDNLVAFHRAVAEGGSFEVEKRYIRPDGMTVLVHNSVTALLDAEQQPASVMCVSIDISDRKATEERLRRSEASLRRIFEQTSDLIITADLDQVITSCNPSAAAAVGLKTEEAIGRPISDFISPGDFQVSSSMLQQKIKAGGTTTYDVRVRSTTGEWLDWEINSGLAVNENGSPVGLHIVARDVTEKRRLEEQKQLLLGELSHRVKNMLTVVQSIAYQTLGRAGSLEEAQSALNGRLAALGQVQDAIMASDDQAICLKQLVTKALAPFCDQQRCLVEGPAVPIDTPVATSFSLALHELATNASKYGALSNGSGRIIVKWAVVERELQFVWQEVGGPVVEAPQRRGFGSRMIERSLGRDLKGSASLDFKSEGVVCTIKAELAGI